MKKVILFLVAIVSIGGNLQAQDTVWQKAAPRSNYFNYRWLDTSDSYSLSIGSYVLSHLDARQFFTSDTLQVYGIAAMMLNMESLYFTPNSSFPDLQSYLNTKYPEDPSFENCQESLVLFQYNENDSMLMLQRGEGLPVHMLYTPVSYWMISPTDSMFPGNMEGYPKPIYERYFSTPQTVYDTFYAGATVSDWEYSKPGCQPQTIRPPFMCVSVGYKDMRYVDEVVAILKQSECNEPSEWCFYRDNMHFYSFIFPILTPEPDTIINPDDTIINPNDTTVNPGDTTGVGLRGVDMIYRYTSVMPNPATEKVRVISSFGLTRIEVYDSRGRLIDTFKNLNAYAYSLDVSSWPRGTYLLRIFTSAGPTTKKLLIQ